MNWWSNEERYNIQDSSSFSSPFNLSSSLLLNLSLSLEQLTFRNQWFGHMWFLRYVEHTILYLISRCIHEWYVATTSRRITNTLFFSLQFLLNGLDFMHVTNFNEKKRAKKIYASVQVTQGYSMTIMLLRSSNDSRWTFTCQVIKNQHLIWIVWQIYINLFLSARERYFYIYILYAKYDWNWFMSTNRYYCYEFHFNFTTSYYNTSSFQRMIASTNQKKTPCKIRNTFAS